MNKVLLVFCFLPLLAAASADTTIQKASQRANLTLTVPQHAKAGSDVELIVTLANRIPQEWTGYLSLELTEAATHQNIDGLLANVFPNQYFTLSQSDSAEVLFPVSLPHRLPGAVRATVRLYVNGTIGDSLQHTFKVKP